MNKIAVSFMVLSLFSTLVLSEDIQKEERGSGIFFGVDYYDGDTELDRDLSGIVNVKFDVDLSGFRLKFGVQDQNNIRFQGYIKVEELEDDIRFLASDGKIFGFGADALFTFPVQQRITPFVLVGMSSDFAELDDPGVDYSEDSLNAFALKAGIGALFTLNKQVELQTGFDM